VILLDVNLLLYAYDADSAQHEAARRWVEEAFSQPEPVLLPWTTVLAFLRIATHPRVWLYPMPMAEAIAIVDEWLARPNIAVIGPQERYWAILKRLLQESQCRGPMVMDAHLAALALEQGATLCSNDKDFARFSGLRVSSPL
jgi:uncharacterized protein